MRCPECHSRIRIGAEDYRALDAHLVEVARAFEERGTHLERELFEANRTINHLRAQNESTEFHYKQALRRNDDLRAQLNEFKTARKPVRRQSAQIRNIA